MHKRLRQGFTIVEIATVIFIIAILATITLAVLSNVQKQSRDNARAADMQLLVGALDKYYDTNGVYPGGCSWTTAVAGCNVNTAGEPTGGVNFDTSTTTSAITSALGLRTDALYDTNSKLFLGKSTSTSSNDYLFWGQTDNPSGSSLLSSNFGSTDPKIVCASGTTIYRYSYLPPRSNGVLVAYLGESDGLWHIYQGKYGRSLRVSSSTGTLLQSTTVGKCVFEN